MIKKLNLNEVSKLVNEKMLFNHHFGFKKSLKDISRDPEQYKKFIEIKNTINDAISKNLFTVLTIYKIFDAKKDKDSVILKDKNRFYQFDFPRQKNGKHLCIADFVQDTRKAALFIVTAKEKKHGLIRALNNIGEYKKAHIYEFFLLSLAEAGAEFIHKEIREIVFNKKEKFSKNELFQKKYLGARFSFGYPACPDLSQQKKLFQILKPYQIGVKLTRGFMMEPESSISSFVVFDKEARYFNLK